MIFSGSPEEIINSFADKVQGSQVTAVILGNRCASRDSDPVTGVRPSAGIILRAVGGGEFLQELLTREAVEEENLDLVLSGGATSNIFREVTEAGVMQALLRETHPQLVNGHLKTELTGREVKSMTHATEALQASLLNSTGHVLLLTEEYYLPRAYNRIRRLGVDVSRLSGVPVNPFFKQFIPHLMSFFSGRYHGYTNAELEERAKRPPLLEYLLEVIVGRGLDRTNVLHDWVSHKYGNYLRFF